MPIRNSMAQLPPPTQAYRFGSSPRRNSYRPRLTADELLIKPSPPKANRYFKANVTKDSEYTDVWLNGHPLPGCIEASVDDCYAIVLDDRFGGIEKRLSGEVVIRRMRF